MAEYRKLIAAVIGLALLLVNRYWGFDLSSQATTIVDLLLAAGTAVGVFQVPNAPATA